MLTLLKVQNLAVVESAEVSFAPGFNVITGETGSGKSVLIGALNLILGERADHGAVRNGTQHLTVPRVSGSRPRSVPIFRNPFPR